MTVDHFEYSQAAQDSNVPLLHVTGRGALFFIIGTAVGVALLWFVPLIYDTYKSHRLRANQNAELLRTMVDALSRRDQFSVEEVRQVVSGMNTPPRGLEGLTRGLLALIIATFVGVALVATLVSTSTDSGDLRKTIVTALLTTLATVAGFYFGARTAQSSTEQATRPPAPATAPAGVGNPDLNSGGSSTAGTPTTADAAPTTGGIPAGSGPAAPADAGGRI